MKRINSGTGGHPERGFTVIELLVTIAVLTIIISMGVPMYGQFTRSSELSGRTTDLIASLNLARSEAVAQGRTIDINTIGADWTSGWNIVRDSDGTLLRTTDLRGSGTSTTSLVETGGRTTFAFDREGRLYSGGVVTTATFTLCSTDPNPSQGRTITVTQFGRVQVVTRTCP